MARLRHDRADRGLAGIEIRGSGARFYNYGHGGRGRRSWQLFGGLRQGRGQVVNGAPADLTATIIGVTGFKTASTAASTVTNFGHDQRSIGYGVVLQAAAR